MNAWLHDLRFALRQLVKHRGFSIVAVLTLAIGIAAATAVFSLVDAVLLRPLPYSDPDRVVSVDTIIRGLAPAGEHYASWPDFFDLRRDNKTLAAMSAYRVSNMTVGRPGTALRRISGTALSAGMGSVLGVRMQLGRDFTADEELAGNRSVILTDALWRGELNADPHAIGRQMQLDGQSYTVVGVLPRGFAFPGQEESQFWTTEGGDAEGKTPLTQLRGDHLLQIVGRLRPGVTLAQATQDLTRIQLVLNAQFADTDAQNDHVEAVPLAGSLTGDVRQPLRILLAAVGFLLLIACVNVAGLMLTRAVARQGELAVRAALGASRTALLRQLLLEAMVLALAGGAMGTALAAAALAVAPRYLPANLPHAATVSLDVRVLLFALGISLATGLLFGVLPAWRASRQQPASALQGNGRSTTAGRGRHRLHGSLVVGETALSLLLLVGAGLLLRSFERVLTVDPGFQTDGLLTFRVAVPANHFSPDQTTRFSQQLQSGLAALPNVSAATYGFPLPLAGGNMRTGFEIPGRPTPPGEGFIARLSTVAPNFFQTMHIPVMRGRTFTTPEDQPNGPHAVIVNEAFAREFFPGQDALDKRIRSSNTPPGVGPLDWQIVGIVGDVKRKDLTEATASEYYLPMGQNFYGTPSFALRTPGDPLRLAESVKVVVAGIDPALPVFNVYGYGSLIARSNALRRFQTILISAFAIVALLLAAIGLYASLSYMVLERTPELGLRIALGSQRAGVLSLVLQRGLWLAAAGLTLGVIAAAWLTRFVGSLLFGVRPLDLATFAATALLLLAVCVLSSLVPAWRASRLNPIETLRQQ